MDATSAVRHIAGVASGVVFRSVEIRRAGAEPRGAVLVLANHGGGLADILAVIDACSRFPRFLARDVIWKVPVARSVISAARAIPVHRREDHRGTADNQGMFADAHLALADGDLLAIYPEGESVPEPRLAPLRTGAARIALGALAKGTDTTILPMGLHYYDVSVLRGRCFVDVGRPLLTSEVVAGLPDHGEVSDQNHQLVHAVTDVFARHLAAVVDEYDDWEQRRRYEAAATIYVRRDQLDRKAPAHFERIAVVANAIARAPAPLRAEVDLTTSALEAELELLGVPLEMLPKVQLAGPKIAAQVGLVLTLLPAAAYGMVINGLPMLALRAVSLTGMAPATAASVKPAVAAVTFPTMWTIVGRAATRQLGTWRGLAVAAAGPLSLVAAVRVAERLQLMRDLGRAARRAQGPLVEQLQAAASRVDEAVSAAVDAGAA
ncbi:MAG: PlsC protein [Actinomycetota bacterium]|nr:PlsC protein [Actinomycetota bacterium]